MITPVASVIIPTYNRCESLHSTLNSLAEQKTLPGIFEVLIVDDGSHDGTSTVVDESFPFLLRYVQQGNQGSAAARNKGAQIAQGKLLVFLDDDMLVSTDYVTSLIEEHKAYSNIVGMGTELPCLPESPSIFARVITTERNTSDNCLATGQFVEFTNCVTNNLSIERESFFEIGMMQDVAGDGPTWWGDVDFGYRANRLGFRFRRSAKAICWHCDYSIQDLATSSRRAEQASYLVHYLIRKYIDIEKSLPMFADKSPINWQLDRPEMIVRKLVRQVASTPFLMNSLEAVVRLFEREYANPDILRPLYRWIIGGYIFNGYRRGLKELKPHD